MSDQHTPGPWQCYADLPSTEPNWHIITNASRLRLVANVHIEPGNAADIANARLLTASPLLLAALQGLVARYEHDGIPNDSLPAVEAARTAIAEATGSSQPAQGGGA
jgi:hypothetical protein